MYRRFVLLLDVEVRFDCAGSHKVKCLFLLASVLRGMYRRFVLLLDVEVRFDCVGSHRVRYQLASRRFVFFDVEVRFDCAGSHKVRCRLLSACVSSGLYRRFVLLLDVDMSFDCAGSHKLDLFRFFSAAPRIAGVLSRGPAVRVSGERSRAAIPALSARVCLPLGMLQPNSNSNSAIFIERKK